MTKSQTRAHVPKIRQHCPLVNRCYFPSLVSNITIYGRVTKSTPTTRQPFSSQTKPSSTIKGALQTDYLSRANVLLKTLLPLEQNFLLLPAIIALFRLQLPSLLQTFHCSQASNLVFPSFENTLALEE